MNKNAISKWYWNFLADAHNIIVTYDHVDEEYKSRMSSIRLTQEEIRRKAEVADMPGSAFGDFIFGIISFLMSLILKPIFKLFLLILLNALNLNVIKTTVFFIIPMAILVLIKSNEGFTLWSFWHYLNHTFFVLNILISSLFLLIAKVVSINIYQKLETKRMLFFSVIILLLFCVVGLLQEANLI